MTAAPLHMRPVGQPFKNVKAIGPHGEEAAKKLDDVYKDLRRRGASSDAQRLLVIDRTAERRDFPALERLAASGQPLDELSEIETGAVRRLVGWRNAAALLPLLATWLLLGWASFNYQHQLSADRTLTTEPFLVLWQHRFGGKPIPTFAETAWTAFGLLIIVLVLTIRAHQLEGRATKAMASVNTKLDDALESLSLAIQTSTVRPPETAREWAEAAQRVLSETQDMVQRAAAKTERILAAAVSETRTLAEDNNRITTSAKSAVEELNAQGRQLIATLTDEVRDTIVAVRLDNEQFIERTAAEATAVLQQAAQANTQLVEHQMTPLFDGFRASLDDYRADQRIYRSSAEAVAKGISDLTAAAGVLASSSQSYTEVAASIDKHLLLIQSTQNEFVTRVTENSASMTTATEAMRQVTTLMSGNLRSDLEHMARNVVDASARLADVDRQLSAASGAIASTTRALEAAAISINAAASRPGARSLWQILAGR
jgi:hypothetical protein